MVLIRRMLALLVLASLSVSVPAFAHKDHDRKQHAAEAMHHSAHQEGASSASQMHQEPMHGAIEMEHSVDEPPLTFMDRLVSWIGRLHPIIVHFPLAFFPAALFTAIVGRRRASFATPVQFLVVGGGALAPLSALFGWLDAIGMDPDPLLTVHRWLGTIIGALGAALAIWAWRKPDQDRSGLMMAALVVITAAIVVQGWFGGALVHGTDHMNW